MVIAWDKFSADAKPFCEPRLTFWALFVIAAIGATLFFLSNATPNKDMITKVMMMVTEIDLLYQNKMIESKYQRIWDRLHFFGFPVQK